MTAQSDPELIDWILNASRHAGDFLKSLAWAALRADPFNYSVLRPVLLEMRRNYPEYNKHDDPRQTSIFTKEDLQ